MMLSLQSPRAAAILLLALTFPALAQSPDDRVVFVCEHGSVKSLIAASLFDRAAATRGLRFRAISRGVNPEEQVPPPIADALQRDGFNVEGFHPQRISQGDVIGARRVIAIGVELPAIDAGPIAAEIWNDIPPASADYAAARAALQRHIDALLDNLQATERKP